MWAWVPVAAWFPARGELPAQFPAWREDALHALVLVARVRGLGALVPWLRATVFVAVLANRSEGYCLVLIGVLVRSAVRTP